MGIQTKNLKAVSNDEELAKIEESLVPDTAQDQEVAKVEQTTEPGSLPTEEKAAEGVPSEDTSTEDMGLTEDELSKVSEKAQRRIRDLSRKVRELSVGKSREEPVIDLGDIEPRQTVTDNRLPWEKPYGSDETDEERVRRIAEETAQQTFNKSWRENKRAEQQLRLTETLERDIEYVKAKYPELDETSKQYNDALATKVVSWYRPQLDRLRGEGKYANFVTFVDDFMSLRKAGDEHRKQETALKVAQQAAEQTLPQGGDASMDITVDELIRTAKSLKDLEQLEKQIRG